MLTLALTCCREKEIIEEREVFVVQQSEKDQQYNEIVKKLKDRVKTSRMLQISFSVYSLHTSVRASTFAYAL